MSRNARAMEFTRRQWLRLAAAGIAVSAPAGWMKALADQAAASPQRKRSCSRTMRRRPNPHSGCTMPARSI